MTEQSTRIPSGERALPDLRGLRVAVANYYLEGREQLCSQHLYPQHHLWGADALAAAGAHVEYLRTPHERRGYGWLDWLSRAIGGRLGRLDYDIYVVTRARDFDLIYAHVERLLITQLLRAIGLIRCPLIYWAYVPYSVAPLWKLRDFWQRWPWRLGIDGLFCLTTATAESYRGRWPRTKVKYLEWGADAEMFPGSPSPGEFFFACGRTNRDYPTLVEAARHVSTPLTILARRSDLGERPLPPNVQFVEGPRDAWSDRGIPYPTLINEYYAKAKAVLICRQNLPGDTSGMTNLMEALAMGRPVAMTRTGSLDYDIEKAGVGRFVAPGDVAGWVDVMKQWGEESPTLAAMRVSARAAVETHFNHVRHGHDVAVAVDEAFPPATRAMRRPLVLRLVPGRLKQDLYYRWYHPVPKAWHHLFAGARLRFAKGVTMELVPSDFMHGIIALTGSYEDDLSRDVVRLARGGGTMIDVGANAGYFSLIWAAADPRNRCLAFEASPRNVKLLRRNIERNGLQDRVTLFDFALGHRNTTLSFDVGPAEHTGWGGLSLESGPSTIDVPVRPLDDLVDPGTTVDFLKIDVEGADTWVLQGCAQMLKRKQIREIHFEQNRPRMKALNIRPGEAVEFLASVGYTAVPLGHADAIVVDWKAFPA